MIAIWILVGLLACAAIGTAMQKAQETQDRKKFSEKMRREEYEKKQK